MQIESKLQRGGTVNWEVSEILYRYVLYLTVFQSIFGFIVRKYANYMELD
jgi:hypothetical protein